MCIRDRYVDIEGDPTMDQRYNPNGSVLAIEGITSPDGRVFGKMGHSERSLSLIHIFCPQQLPSSTFPRQAQRWGCP